MFPGKRWLPFIITVFFISITFTRALAQNYIFAQMSGTPLNTSGWNLQGAARVTNVLDSLNSELLICPAVLGTSGAAFWNQPINLSLCSKWIAEFDFRMYDGSGADGLAFCFLDVPPSGFVTGGGLGIPSTANGLKVCFDTYNNCGAPDIHFDMPKIEIRWGIGYNDNSNPNNVIVGECLNEPTRDNSDGKLSFMRGPNYSHAKITYDSGNISVYVNDTLYLTGYQQFNFTGYLGFTASTGGYTDNHSIKNVIIYTQMPPSIAGKSQSFCPYQTIQLGGASNPGYLYVWSPSTGLSDTTVAAPLLNLKNDSLNSQYFKYYVKTSFGTNPGCASTDSVILRVYPQPRVNFLTPEICLTDAIASFTDSSYTGDSTTLPFTWLWNFGDPNAKPSNPNSSVLQNPTHLYSAASNYNVSLKVTNSMGCADSLTKVFTVNGAIPLAGFTVNNAGNLCSNQMVQITNNSSVNFGSIIKLQISWGDSANVVYTDSAPYPGKIYVHTYPNPLTTAVTPYTISMTSFSGTLCQNQISRQINIQPSPHALFTTIPAVCTYTSPFQITQASEQSGVAGTFSFSGNGVSSMGIFNPNLAGAGIDTILYRYLGADGCSDSATQTIMVVAPPIVKIGHDTIVVINQPLQLQAVSNEGNLDSFQWSPVTGLDNPSISNPVAILGPGIDSIRYVVTATDSLGCYAADSIEVKIYNTLPDFFVPNAFTPTSSANRLFRPIPIGISSIEFFRVYNRWGQLVFHTSQAGAGWDGYLAGRLQDAGTYVWMVRGRDYTGKLITKQGTMILIK